jgi:membrane-associated protease RseP (regulator of RpoE activity)
MRVRFIVIGALAIAIGIAAVSMITSRRPAKQHHPATAARASPRAVAQPNERADDSRQRATLERQILMLTAKVADEAAKRQHLEDQVESLSAQVAALTSGSGENKSAQGAPAGVGASAPAMVAEPMPNPAAAASISAMERALVAAGVDVTTAADMKKRHDDLTMAEIYLRDQATREQWLDSPRFREELDAIQAQRTSVRDDIGDDAYDRYLFAQGQANRVRVDDVMLDSVAAEAGLQSGDIVLRYGDTRIFAPEELVNETRSGRAGESIRLEIIRNGARLEMQVPRGPLGLRIAASQSEPTS